MLLVIDTATPQGCKAELASYMLVTCRPTVCTDGDDQAAGIQSDFDDDDDRDDCLWSDTEFDVDEPEPDPPVRHL